MSNSNTYFKLCAFLLKVEVFFFYLKSVYFSLKILIQIQAGSGYWVAYKYNA